jgi:hypothetical protein
VCRTTAGNVRKSGNHPWKLPVFFGFCFNTERQRDREGEKERERTLVDNLTLILAKPQTPKP